MCAMGPEVAILNGRQEGRAAWRKYTGLEYPAESPLYVAAAVRARVDLRVAVLPFERPLGPWARFRKALRRSAGRAVGRPLSVEAAGGRRAGSTPSVFAVPAAVRADASLPRRDSGAGLAPISALPVYGAARR